MPVLSEFPIGKVDILIIWNVFRLANYYQILYSMDSVTWKKDLNYPVSNIEHVKWQNL